MSQFKVFAAVGGGAGDIWWDWVHDRRFAKIPDLVERYGARVRIYSQCHCLGTATDLFQGHGSLHPYAHQIIEEPWEMPSPELNQRWNNPDADGYIPITRDDLLHAAGVRRLDLKAPTFYLSDEERWTIQKLATERPCIVAQPYAGLSDRDAFDPASLARLATHLHDLDRNARLLVIGKNHERGHKYNQELCPAGHPNVVNLIDKLGIRVAYHLVAACDAFVGAHSNLIRAAWDHRRRTALVIPDPMMTNHWPKLDSKYTYGCRQPENRTFTFPFDHDVPRRFDLLDTGSLARFLLRGE